MARHDPNALKLLHIEDDENDAVLFSQACQYAGLPVCLIRARDAVEATAYLLGQGHFADRAVHPLPQLIILDLKLPGMDGFDFLRWLRGIKDFAGLPVLVFTASSRDEDRERALSEGANSYFIKPPSFEALVNMIRELGHPGQQLN